MLIRAEQRETFEWQGLCVHDFGPLAEGSASAAVIDVPARAEHPSAYSAACHKLYFVQEGQFRFNVDGVAYTARTGDLVVIPKGIVFSYWESQGVPARLLLVHTPPFEADAEHVLPALLRRHDIQLHGERVSLRPMTEDDWDYVLAWNSDPEVLIWADCTDEVRPEEETKAIYRGDSLFAYVFIIEVEGEPIGECWLQKMNLPDIIDQYPGRDLRRIDLMIGRKDLWGRGLGTDTIRTLAVFAFEQEKADGIFGLVEAANIRSWRAFQKAGFGEVKLGADERALVLWRS